MGLRRKEHQIIWVFPKIGVPQNGWFIIENLIKMDDLGGTTILGNPHTYDSAIFCLIMLMIVDVSIL